MRELERNTKNEYLFQAMRLFAERGYDAVGVADIAKAVGCTTSALYKHYKNKAALFDAIIEQAKAGFEENMKELNIGFDVMSDDPNEIKNNLVALAENIFIKIAFDEEPTLFRRLVEKERIFHPELAVLYNKHYIDWQLSSFEKLMNKLIEAALIKNGDAQALAVEFISPIIAMINYCDNDPSGRERAVGIVKRNVELLLDTHLTTVEDTKNQ